MSNKDAFPVHNFPDGLYDRLIDQTALDAVQHLVSAGFAQTEPLTGSERRRRLSAELARYLADLLDDLSIESDVESEQTELALINSLLITLRHAQPQALPPNWLSPLRVLRAVHRHGPTPQTPITGLSEPWLFTVGRGDPALMTELRRELAAADQVDVLVSFITWSGIRKLWDVLEMATTVGAKGQAKTRLRILTTTYTGATEVRALEALGKLPGVEIRVSLDGRRTRLHAKAWIFHRLTGFGSAYVGSANLSAAALMGGLEWTVKFTEAGQSPLYIAAAAHFETLWNDPEFQPFDPRDEKQVQQLRAALKTESGNVLPGALTWFGLEPKNYQKIMLDRLAHERRHGRRRNLVVAATGTGKTVVAAFDYRRLCEETGGRPKLLFVAHRVELLIQARDTYRQVLRQADFGELLADGSEPSRFEHLFATIASVLSRGLLNQLGTDYWYTVVIDECHHLPAVSFDTFARTVKPNVLLGLTATPERTDGKPILDYFDTRPDGGPAVELRLWDALEQQLLVPFEYYGIGDDTDLRTVPWGQSGETATLDKLIGTDSVRAFRAIDEFKRLSTDWRQARVLAFCVSIRHAEFMADCFQAAGIPALAVTGQTPIEIRRDAPRRLAAREINVLCICDLYNEGIDIPEVDTLLLLRPTQSPVLYQQQLGRGLRLFFGKTSCLILDFVGRHREDFRFDRLYQILTGLSRFHLIKAVEQGFSQLPPGCHLYLDRVSRERVLASLRQVTQKTWPRLRAELSAYVILRGTRNIRLAEFIRDQGLEIGDLYRKQSPSGWMALRRAVGLETRTEGPDELWLGRRYADLLNTTDPTCLNLWQRVAKQGATLWPHLDDADCKRVQMLAYQLHGTGQTLLDGPTLLAQLDANPVMLEELGELATYLDEASDLDPRPLPGVPTDWPLTLYASYSRREILTAVGYHDAKRRPSQREGVLPLQNQRIELLFVTLDKREGFHSAVAYHDYAISPERFHWQTQNSAGPETKAGLRYLESSTNGWRFQLFVRETRDNAFVALGPVILEKAESSKPMSITWRLAVPLPAELFRRYSVLRA